MFYFSVIFQLFIYEHYSKIGRFYQYAYFTLVNIFIIVERRK